MIAEHETPIPPPTGEQLDVILSRVRDGVAARVAESRAARRSAVRRWLGVIGAIVLFGSGVAVGGSALPRIANDRPALSVDCYDSQAPDAASYTMTYQDEHDAVAARHDPVGVCRNATAQAGHLTGIDDVVRGLIRAGHDCGVVRTTEGTAWSYEQVDGSLAMTTGHFATPLSPHCVTVNNVALPGTSAPTAFACTVNSSRTVVYPGNPEDGARFCDSKGYIPVATR